MERGAGGLFPSRGIRCVQGDRSGDSLGFGMGSPPIPPILPRCQPAVLDVSFSKRASPLRPWKCKGGFDWGGGVGGEAGCCYIGCLNFHSPLPFPSLFILKQDINPRPPPWQELGDSPGDGRVGGWRAAQGSPGRTRAHPNIGSAVSFLLVKDSLLPN